MTATTLTRPETAQPAAGGTSSAAHRRSPLLRPYLGYVGYFVGAGLISGGIVHYPLDPSFYARIAVAGVALFLAATVLNDIVLSQTQLAPRGVVRVLGASLLLSIGIGMLSGGIQHFTDFPTRAATLVPAGMVLSFAAYMLRNGAHGQMRRLGGIAAAVLLTAGATFVGLQALATDLAAAGTGDHSHGGTPAGGGAGEEAETGHADGHADGHAAGGAKGKTGKSGRSGNADDAKHAEDTSHGTVEESAVDEDGHDGGH